MNKTKKNILLFSLMFVIITFLISMLMYWTNNLNISRVSLIKPSEQKTTHYIYSNGVIVEQSKKDVKTSIPLVPEKVYAKIGDYVENGEVLAKIDIAATQSMLIQYIESLTNLPAKYTAAINSLDIDLNKYLKYIPEIITAPATGYVTSVSMIEGFSTATNFTLATISNTNDLIAKFQVSENNINSVSEGDKIVFKATATKDIKYIGVVALISPIASQTLNGTNSSVAVDVYVKITSKKDKLKPGYSIFGAIKDLETKDIITIPYESINQDNENNEFVYIYKDFKAVKKEIITGEEYGEYVEVVSGISKDMLVIEDNNTVKKEGAIVFVKNEKKK